MASVDASAFYYRPKDSEGQTLREVWRLAGKWKTS
jgi:hypothetical protein